MKPRMKPRVEKIIWEGVGYYAPFVTEETTEYYRVYGRDSTERQSIAHELGGGTIKFVNWLPVHFSQN